MAVRKNLFKFLAAVLIFIVCDVWIYRSLLDSFRSYYKENSMKVAKLFAQTVPRSETAPEPPEGTGAADSFQADPSYYQEWLDQVPQTIEGGEAMILGIDENFNFVPAAATPLAEQIWAAHSGEAEFQKGLESVYYLLPYEVSGTVQAMRIYLLPIPDESGFDLSGAVMIAVPVDGAVQFERLLRNLGIIALLIFAVLLAVAMFARDPITGYAVVFLFGTALVFVAYPLLESFRLTFVDAGAFTLSIWKRTFSPNYLVSLWGSVKLGIITASVSTLIGFAFAFLTERTGVRCKKLIGTLATMPVISPPFPSPFR